MIPTRLRCGARLVPLAALAITIAVVFGHRIHEPGRDGRSRLPATLEVLGPWAGVEQQRFTAVLQHFGAATHATVRYTSAPDALPTVLMSRVDERRQPDVALLPQPGLLHRLAATGRLAPLDSVTTRVVEGNYAPVWRQLASYHGRLYGVWFKAADKSLVWYNVAAFERAGVVPPATLRDLMVVERRMRAAGIPPFALSGADGWTLTDWFENVYLRVAGPAEYDRLARHAIPWTDSSVIRSLRVLDGLWSPGTIAGGVAAARATGFETAVARTFGRPSTRRPWAAMLFEGDFVGGIVTGRTTSELGVDVDVFPFPAWPDSGPGDRSIVGGGDVAVVLRSSPAAAALVRFLATPQAAAIWASHGGFVSPNLNLDLAVYPDDLSRAVARGVLDAGDQFRFDLSDVQPTSFGGTETSGLWDGLRAFLLGRPAELTARRLEADAQAAYRSGSTHPAAAGRQ